METLEILEYAQWLGSMTLTEEQELEMLREFFDCWVAFHSLQRSDRERQELAAQRMVDAANTIKAYRQTQPVVLNG
jgi:hypothetical protein